MKSRILFSNKSGQLGNRLFAFSHFIANAAENNYAIVNLSFDEYARYFQTTHQDVFCRYPFQASKLGSNRIRSFLFIINKIILKLLRSASWMSSSWHEIVLADVPEYKFHEGRFYQLKSIDFHDIIHSNKFVFVFGRFFRDFENFAKHQQIIRNYFQPIPKIKKNVAGFLEKVRRHDEVLVGVHIRRGDYKEFLGGKYFYSHHDYYAKMLELQANESGKKFTFVVCSNEDIDINLFKGLSCFKGPGNLVEDLYIFAGCDFIFGPPSTYTRWASFYGSVPLFQLDSLQNTIRLSSFLILENNKLFDF